MTPHPARRRTGEAMASFDDRGLGQRIHHLHRAPRVFAPAGLNHSEAETMRRDSGTDDGTNVQPY